MFTGINAVHVYGQGRTVGRPERRRMFLRRQVARVVVLSTLFGSGAMAATDVSATPAYASSLNGTTAYVANFVSNSVTPIDTTNNTAGTPIPVGLEPEAIAITPNGATAYVANYGSGTVTPIDTANNTAGTPIIITAGSGPDTIAITPNGATAYVVNAVSNSVIPIDTANNTAGTPITVASDPYGIAITPDQAPVAALSVSAATVGYPSNFNALGSTVSYGTITSYAWNFGDGTNATTTTPTTTHVYASPGIYLASVTETDSRPPDMDPNGFL